AGVQAPGTVHLVFVGSPNAGDLAWHLRHLIELREGASLSVVEHQIATDIHNHLSNSLTHVHLAPNATLSHARVQDEALGATVFARTDAVLARGGWVGWYANDAVANDARPNALVEASAPAFDLFATATTGEVLVWAQAWDDGGAIAGAEVEL
ncbi:SufD family Fe-S cluster assembly protein, partial [Lysobacter sp. 2RAB21]